MTDLADLETKEATTSATSSVVGSIVVLDTCVLLADPEALFAFGDAQVVVPLTVIEELDQQKTRMDDVGRAARTTVRTIEELRVANGGDIRRAVPLATGGSVRIEINGLRVDALRKAGLDPAKEDNRILAAALGLQEQTPHVKVVSADAALRIKAAQLGLVAEDYHRTRSGGRTTGALGWQTVAVTRALVDALYDLGSIALDDLGDTDAAALSYLRINEFAVLQSGQSSALARRTAGGIAVVPQRLEAWGLRPRSKEQRFALDLLLDEEVRVVGLSGHAGTGKTILALAAGLEQVFEPASARYDRMMILRPIVSVGRQELGFLPGTLEEKLGPWMEAITDAVVALGDDISHRQARELLAAWVGEGKLTMEAVTYLRGRSLQNTFVLVDEAQNLEPTTLKTILTRIGQGSKVVLVGDTSQIDSPYLSDRNNALSVLADAFAGEALFGHLVLTQGERSAVADLAAARL